MNDKESTTQLGEIGEEVMSGIAFNVKRNRASILQDFVDDAFSDAIASLPSSERAEISKRLRKLFINSFKTPEMDRLVRDKVAEHARKTCEAMVVAYGPRIEAFMQEELEMTWKSIVSGYVKSLLAGAIVKVGEVFARKIDALANETYQEGLRQAGTPESIVEKEKATP